ncbi:MAG TPA: DUF692 domain-containing protein, partial [Longimicrobiaceae bacterium]|nr:DUF692 domain-containing protein [Longimicrobiaceae bacterium]
LGVGVLYNPSLARYLDDGAELLDYLAVIPDRFWTDRGEGASPRFTELEGQVDVLDRAARRLPVVGHAVGLSIGSAELWDAEYVDQLARWRERYRFPWHSEHLSFLRVPGEDAHSELTGLAIPVPYDAEVLELVAGRVEEVQRAVDAPFIIENNVYYVDLPEQEMTEPEFLNRLTERTGCGLLLDVHNVYVNSVNHGFDPRGFVDALDLTRVVEVHVASGSEMAGMYSDSHSGPCPEPVWELLDRVVAGAPNLCGITFEFGESYFPRMGEEGLRAQLRLAREAWARRR